MTQSLHKTYYEHFAHFLIKHAEELDIFLLENGTDFYTEYNIAVRLFNYFAEDYLDSDDCKYHGISLTDVIHEDWVFDKAVELYNKYQLKEYKIEVDVSMTETITVRAQNKAQAEEMLFNDIAKYSPLVRELSMSDHYNGVDVNFI